MLRGASQVTGGTNVGSLRAGDSFGERSVVYGGVRSATVVTDTPCELFSLGLQKLHEVLGDDLAARLQESLVLSCVKQSSVMSHFSSTQQLEIVRVMETSSYAAGVIVLTRKPLFVVLCLSLQSRAFHSVTEVRASRRISGSVSWLTET